MTQNDWSAEDKFCEMSENEALYILLDITKESLLLFQSFIQE